MSGDSCPGFDQDVIQEGVKYSIIIVSYKYDLKPCLESIEKHSTDHEVIIIDNNEHNRGFAKACNEGAEKAKGDYLVFLNPDTIVSEEWLPKMAEKLIPGVGAVGPVSDYVAGLQKAQLYLGMETKPIETKLLIGFCLMIHSTVFPGMDENLFLGNDDLDLCWRLRLHGLKLIIATDVFIHHEGQQSFKSNPEADRLVQCSTDALHLKLLEHYHGSPPTPQELWGIDWFKPRKLVSIIVLCWNQLEYTKQCVSSVLKYTDCPYELILIDNGSTDDTAKYLWQHGDRVISNSRNHGVARGWNQGIWEAKGDYVVVLNNDTIVTPGWLKSMVETSEATGAGIVGPRSNNISGPQQIDNLTLNSKEAILKMAEVWNSAKLQPFECDRIVGFCMLIKRKVLNTIGLFDERFGMGNYEDDDYCLRALKAGFKNVVCNQSFVFHYRSKSYDDKSVDWLKLMEENRIKFEEKHGMDKR